ncbi:MAG: hypothetical protein RIR51_288 [Bacteroidota bacterium]|jgi:putative membrane protein
MLKFLIRYVIIAGLISIIPNYLKGIQVDGYTTAFIVALVFGFLNAVIKPIIKIISLPITILTLGLFSLVINVAIVYFTSGLIDGFTISGFITPLLFSFAISITNSILETIL